MWYLRFSNKIRRWENDLWERNNWTKLFGQPSVFVFGFAIPGLVFLLLMEPIIVLTGMSYDAYGYILFGVPAVIFILLFVFGD